MKNIPPTFIYCVRTGSQIDVVYDKIKKPNEINFFNACFLKSRKFHCLNEDLKQKYQYEDLSTTSKKMTEKPLDDINCCSYYKGSIKDL